ncbi:MULTISPECIES: metallophosphoesterase [Kurthia]|uniref:metallophosphoesterase n=1 Tax=Kurthia TaxID=1649 RepID=UPI00254CC6C1|nr:metallophosphoesterase [Kurthia sp. YJT4]WIL37323.1 metallophosphoesterase [Kurthia sp. YJT4]
MKKLIKIIGALVVLFVFYIANNQWLQLSKHTLQVKTLPKEMNGLTIVQISDLHDAKFGRHQQRLIEQVKKQKPDLIFLTGDLIDRNNYKLGRSLEAVDGFTKIAPTYFVDGNHEISINRVKEIHTALQKRGVHVLNNEAETFYYNGARIQLIGISDPLSGETTEDMLAKALVNVPQDQFKILLAHRSEFGEKYAQAGIDLAYTGHAHGGQIRLPFLGGLVDHDASLLPKHTEGIEQVEQLQHVISRGLGNSLFPLRVFNRPEIVVTILESK